MTRLHARRTPVMALAVLAIAAVLAAGHGHTAADTWRGLAVAPEHRCSPYDRGDHPYPQSVEAGIVASMGGRVYGPYTGRHFRSARETDIDHVVALSEAHDSGLCAAAATVRRRFASDPLNLTLAAPEVNRCGTGGKCGFDIAEWQPAINKCWFAARVVAIKRKYGLSVDLREAAALERVLAGCDSTAMIVTHAAGTTAAPRDAPAASSDALRLYASSRKKRPTRSGIRCTTPRRQSWRWPCSARRGGTGCGSGATVGSTATTILLWHRAACRRAPGTRGACCRARTVRNTTPTASSTGRAARTGKERRGCGRRGILRRWAPARAAIQRSWTPARTARH